MKHTRITRRFGMILATLALALIALLASNHTASAQCTNYYVDIPGPILCPGDFIPSMAITAIFNGGTFTDPRTYPGTGSYGPYRFPAGATALTGININGTVIPASPEGIQVASSCPRVCMKVTVVYDVGGCPHITITYHNC
jgi:hypothetical protein